ncbi:MAG TPA: TIGR02206 family membrane protein [Solirubrobacteraceae bacterium]|nr:TIGR02206 family membrane protein [Solirubrobacteraceae bacterium]
MAAAAACVWIARRRPEREVQLVARALALLILAAWAGEYIADAVLGSWSVQYDLPLQLTDAISIVSALALWTRRQWLVELCYLWSMTATLQALITPDLGYTFPSVFYFTYFTYHGGAIVAACLLVFGERRYPTRHAVARAYGAALAWACVAGLADLITGGNYMYLHEKPEHASLVSIMGGWPWYVLETALVVAPILLLVAQGLATLVRRLDVGPAVGAVRAG